MTNRARTFLYAFAGWTVFVWVVFIRNITKDKTHTAAFKEIHVALALVSIAFALGTFVVVRQMSRKKEVEDPSTSATPSVRP